MNSKETKYHKTLSNYFSSQPHFLDGGQQKKPQVRKCMELPFQQTKARLWDEVTDTLCNLEFIQAKACAKMTYDLVKDFNAVLQEIPDNAENIRVENERQARMGKYTRDLISYAQGEIKELDIPQSITPWTQEQIDAEVERIKTNPNRTDKLKDFINFLGQETDNLQKYASEFANFTIQQAWNSADCGPVCNAAHQRSLQSKKHLLLRANLNRPAYNPLPQVLKILKVHTAGVNAVSLTPDGKRAVSGSGDKTCIFWDMEMGQAIHTLKGHTSLVNAVSVTPDGKRAISGSNDNNCIVWDLENGQMLKMLKGHSKNVTSVSITSDGKLAVSGSWDTSCIVWDLETGQAVHMLKGHTKSVNVVSVTPDGKHALSGSADKSCIVWDLETGQILRRLEVHTNEVTAICSTPDGKRAVSGARYGPCIVWDLESGQAIQALKGHTSAVSALSITPDGKYAVSGAEVSWVSTGYGRWDETCIVWDLKTGQSVRELKGHTSSVSSVCLSPNGKRVMSGSNDKTCIVWDLETGQVVHTLKGHSRPVSAVSVMPNGKLAVSGSTDKTCVVWNLENGQLHKILKGDRELGFINDLSVTLDGKCIVTGGALDNTCIVWDMESGQVLKKLIGNARSVSAVCVTPDGKCVVSGSQVSESVDGICIVWDMESGQALNTMQWHKRPVSTVSVTPDGKCVVSGSAMPGMVSMFGVDGTCIVWDLGSGKLLNTLKGHIGWSVYSVIITPDGKHAISGSEDKTCIVWDLESGQPLNTLKGHTSSVNSVGVTPDGKYAVSGSSDGTCIVWDMKSEEMLARFIHDATISAVTVSGKYIILGGSSGKTVFLSNQWGSLCPGPGIVTLKYIWAFEKHQYLPITGDCIFCGFRFSPEQKFIDTIKSILRNNNIELGDSPCLKLAKEAWEEPGLLGNCPKCGGELKFNPFIAGGDY